MKRVVMMGMLLVIGVFADLKKDALKSVPQGWEVDPQEMVVADFNKDFADDIALVYYKIDEEFENRVNRVLVLISYGKKLVPVVDQRFPADQDFSTEVMINYENGILKIFQHMGFMHRFNEWGIAWDELTEGFWERTYASGGILGLGAATGYDALTGLGYVEKVWEDVNVSCEYSTIFAEKLAGSIKLDGYDNELGWQRCWVADNYWITYGEDNWSREEDASLKIKALYDEDSLYLFVEVTDDEFVFPSNPDEVLASDHLELWFDMLTEERAETVSGYVAEPWKRKKDPFVSQIAVVQSASGKPLVERWLPAITDNQYIPDIQAGFYREPGTGTWVVEMGIPWDEFSPEGVLDYLSFTIVYSDSDNPSNPKQETLIGTSQLRWAEPFTFGSLMTEKPDRIYWGVYPEED